MPVTIIPSKPVPTELSGTFRFIGEMGIKLFNLLVVLIWLIIIDIGDDFEAVLDRSRLAGVQSMIITGGSLRESKTALSLAAQHGFFATVGCHPTRSKEFDDLPQALDSLISANLHGKGRVVAIGECGLDYDRTHFAPEDVQRRHFRSQLFLAKKYKLPLFLHSRAAHKDFVNILRDEGFGEDGERKGVVHSFTGVNGCSLKTEQNMLAAKAIRPDKLLLETDAPWCSMTSTHASNTLLQTLPASLKLKYFPSGTKLPSFMMGKPVKGRNEPSAIGGVAWVMHMLNEGVPFEKVTEKVYKNTVQLFGLDEL
ncbi:hypothetical protein EDB19DRAFT_1658822 [Suillus lakei]|nr:hypothetical protein EDB19DRAFT_1658822 [Suillus lakei]